ncbi:MAG TPA: hypothetical protein VGB55_05225 [Tepidisphaeraceae bacterium]
MEAYIGQHSLTRDDVVNVVCNPTGEDTSDSSGRPIRFGFALDGRAVAVVFERVDEITILPITAYEVKP